jgi:5-methyltetrahydrofolate--homocysteine methyltransferase
VKVFETWDLNEIAEYIDWQPFFIAWEMHGKFPQLLSDNIIGEAATRLYKDAQALLKKIIQEKWLNPRGAIGIWPASATADDTVSVYSDTNNTEPKPNATRLEFLRQQSKKTTGQSNISLADFIAPAETRKTDYIGAFSVTIEGIEKHIARFMAELDDYNKIILQALADRLAEAFAEMLHKKVRTEYWGYQKTEHLTNEQLIKEEYSGIRPAPGYPACPDHTEKYKLFHLLGGEKTTGITLTESLAMYPASSVSGWYFANPESKYFGIGKISKDQVLDYAARKNMEVADIERWLRPVLDYEA